MSIHHASRITHHVSRITHHALLLLFLVPLSLSAQLSFTYAPLVSTNQLVTWAPPNNQAKAIRDRIISGVGDPVWRVFYKAHSMVREINNEYAREDLFWEYAMHAGTNWTLETWWQTQMSRRGGEAAQTSPRPPPHHGGRELWLDKDARKSQLQILN